MSSISWILIAAAAPLLWAVVNHIDKYFLSNSFSSSRVGMTGGLMIFSTLFSVVVLPVLYFIDPAVIYVSVSHALLLISVGILNASSIYLYLKALDKDEASIVVPLWQMIPVFGFLFGLILLGETLTTGQLIGGILVVGFSALLTLELDFEQGIKLKKGIFLLMMLSSAFFALGETVFKMGAMETNFMAALFWGNIGLLIFGLTLCCITTYRKSFFLLMKDKFGTTLGLNLGSEALTVLGNTLSRYAILLAPVAAVLAIAGLQPMFVLVIGVLITLLIPKLQGEKISSKHLVQKIICITAIVIGTTILGIYS